MIAGVVVLFNSPKNVLENIATYIDQVDFLFAVDNSPETDRTLVDALCRSDKIKYLGVGRNRGIAYALNLGATAAAERGFDFVLMMDHDSQAAPNMISSYRVFLNARTDLNAVGILAPCHYYKNYTDKIVATDLEVLTTITSGSLLNVKAYKKAGPFLEELFIDYVDFEYCLRLRSLGYKVCRVGGAVLYHTLGELISHKIFLRKVGVTNHSPLRLYYRTRNRLYVAKKYFRTFPGFVVTDGIVFVNELIKILFFETGKFEKFRMILRGMSDFVAKKSGEYSTV